MAVPAAVVGGAVAAWFAAQDATLVWAAAMFGFVVPFLLSCSLAGAGRGPGAAFQIAPGSFTVAAAFNRPAVTLFALADLGAVVLTRGSKLASPAGIIAGVVILIAAVAVAGVLLSGRPRLTLDRAGLTLVGLRRDTVVAWDDLVPGSARLTSGNTRTVLQIGRTNGAYLNLPITRLYVGQAFLAAAMKTLLAHPDARAGIGTAEGLQRLQATAYGRVFAPTVRRPLVSSGSVPWWTIGFAALAFGLTIAVGGSVSTNTFSSWSVVPLLAAVAIPLAANQFVTRGARTRTAALDVDEPRRRFVAPATVTVTAPYLICVGWAAAGAVQLPHHDSFFVVLTVLYAALVVFEVTELLRNRPRVVLDAEALTLTGRLRSTRVGWDDLLPGSARATDDDVKVRRTTGVDLVLPARGLRVDPIFLAAVIGLCVADPSLRAEVGTPDGLRHFQDLTAA